MQEITVYDIYGNSLTNLVQWDEDVMVCVDETEITKAYRMHFFNTTMDNSLVVDGTYSDGILKAKIPNVLLTQPYPVIGYVYVEKDNESKSVYTFKIHVRKKPQPNTFIYKESEDYIRAEKILDGCIEYAKSASASADKSIDFANLSKSYAIGGTSTRENEDTDNSKYYYELSQNEVSKSEAFAIESMKHMETASIYANNAKNYADQAKNDADAIATQKQDLITVTNNANIAINNANAATSNANAATSHADAAANNANNAAQAALDSITNIGEKQVVFDDNSSTEDFESGEK